MMLAFVALLWALKVLEVAAGLDLVPFGVFPRRLSGLGGVLLAPLIHGSWSHLVANSAPLLVLGTAVLYGYPRSARIVLPVVYLGAGLAVWLFARPSFHVGASGLGFGLLSFVFTIGVLRWERQAIALAMIVSFLYGSMIWGIFPYDASVSWETHLSGALIGIVLAFALKWFDPPRPRKRYSWEDEEQDACEVEGTPDEQSQPRPGTSVRTH
jgi:membrane associated rhomboid family serine protease